MIGKSLAVLVALATVLGSGAAHAAESPRNWILDLRFGGYSPEVDDDLRGRPFEDVFGDKNRLLTQLSLERFFFQDFGTLGAGLNLGYAEFFGKGFIPGTNQKSSDSTSLRVIPVTVFADYRFDWAAIHWKIPLVPYAKGGFGYWFWWTENGLGETSGDGDGKGTKLGFTWSAGLKLLLDFFDPYLANEFDREFGVNNTYLYIDYTQWHAGFQANIFKHGISKKGLDFSDNIVSGGLAFEF